MNVKEKIFGFLQESDATVPELAVKAAIDENQARVYVNRLRIEGKAREVSKNGRAKVWTVARASPAAPGSTCDPRVLADLRFLNEFFKENIDHLFKSKKIQEFVVNHAEFDEVEKLCQA